MAASFAQSPDPCTMKPPIGEQSACACDPSIRRVGSGGSMLAVSLLQPLDGEWLVRHGSLGPRRLRRGELLVVRESYLVEASPLAGSEALLFFAPPDWATRAQHLARMDRSRRPERTCVEPADSDVARRAGRLLAEGHIRACSAEAEDEMASAVRHLALLSIAREARNGLDCAIPEGPSSGSRHRSDLLRVLEAFEEEESLEDCSLERFAERLSLSPRHASRLFRQELGCTFSDYMLKLRIDRAKKLLLSTDQSVTDIAMLTGWGSLSHFNATFRRRVGATPSEFRSRAA